MFFTLFSIFIFFILSNKMFKPSQILIILIITLVIVIILTILQNTKTYDMSKMRIFFNMINIISFILLGVGLIMTSYALIEGQNINRIKKTNDSVDRSYIRPIKSMNELFDNCPNFVASLWPQKNIFQNAKNAENVENAKNVDKESSVLELSAIMLQAMEDQLVSDKYNFAEWEPTFLQWASSKKFYEMFLALYPNYTHKTIEYAKIIFEYAQKYPIHSGEDLEKVGKLVKKDSRLKKLKK